MVYNQAQSARLGQRTPVENTYVRMFGGDETPEAAWEGQLIYRNDTQALQIFNGNAWENVVSGEPGVLTFIGAEIPVSQHVGDIWFNTADNNRMYVAAVAGADEIAVGEWEVISSDPPPITPTTHIYHQDTPPGPTDDPPPKDYDFWFETPGNKQYYYLSTAPGTHWVAVRDSGIQQAIDAADAADQSAIDAAAAASTAQLTANGKNTVTYSTVDPGTTANKAGDIWFTFSGSVVSKQWRGLGGTAWSQVTLTSTVLSNIDAGVLTAGSIRAEKLSVTTGGSNILENSSFETTVVTQSGNAYDYFTRSDGSLGVDWVRTDTPPTIVSGRVVHGASAGAARWFNASNSTNQYSQATYQGGTPVGVAVAMTNFAAGATLAAAGTWYMFQKSDTGTAIVQKDVGATTFTTLATEATELVAGEVMRLEYNGTTLTAKVNGVTRITHTPTTPITGQNWVGFYSGEPVTGQPIFDDFTGSVTMCDGWSFNFGARGSYTFSNTYWRGSRSVQVNHATNGDGTCAVFPNTVVRNGTSVTVSIFVKILEGTQDPTLWNITRAGAVYIVNNPATSSGDSTVVCAAVGDGWYRVSRTFKFTSDGNFRPFLANTNGTTANDTVVLVDCAQIERGDMLTAYGPKVDEILPGTIQAEHIKAGSITADKMTIGTLVNLMRDPNAEQGLATWSVTGTLEAQAQWLGVSGISTPCPGDTNAKVIQYTADGNLPDELPSELHGDMVPCTPGEFYRYSFYGRHQNTASGGTITAALQYYDSDEALLEQATYQRTATSMSNDAWYQFLIEDAVPAGAAYVQPQIIPAGISIGASYQFDVFNMSQQMTGELIVNGAISGQYIYAPTIEGGEISASAFVGGTVSGTDITATSFATTGANGDSWITMGGNWGTDQIFWYTGSPYGGASLYAYQPTDTPCFMVMTAPKNGNYGGASSFYVYAGNTNFPAYSYATGRLLAGSHVEAAGGVKAASLDNGGGGTTQASVSSTGWLGRWSSSIRYKTDVQPMTSEQARSVLKLKPVTYRLRDDIENMHNVVYPGCIAEQAAEAGAELWLTKDKHGQPDGVRYSEIAVALVQIINEQQSQIDALEQRVTALEGTT